MGIGLGFRQPFGVAPSATFTPASLSGLVAWFDMQDATSFTVTTGSVHAVTNKASSVAWTEATNAPAYSATGFNGRPCMDFDGTDDRIVSTEAAVAAMFAGASPGSWTIFSVVSYDVADAQRAFFSWSNASVLVAGGFIGQNNAGLGRWSTILTNDTPTTINAISAGNNDTNLNVEERIFSGTTTSIIINGGPPDPSELAFSPGSTSVTRAGLGCRCRPTIDLFHDGKLAEHVVYNRALTPTERGQVRAYLGAKWGITVA